MIIGSYLYYSPYINFFINLRDDKLVNNPLETLIKSNNSPTPIFRALSYTPTLKLIFILVSGLVPILNNQVDRYTNKKL